MNSPKHPVSGSTKDRPSPAVSIVIPTFNAAQTIRETLASVRSQTFPDYEVIVVDDASTDDTVNLVRSEFTLARRSSEREGGKQSLPAVARGAKAGVIVLPENQGASAARNRGIREARGKYVAFLDADDVWLPEKLSRQFDVLEQHPEFGAVHCGTLRMDRTGAPLPGGVSQRKQRINGDVFMEFFEANLAVILTSTVLIPTTCFNSIGIFDGSGEVVDDHDFFLRLAAQYPIWYLDEPLVRYRVVPGSLGRVRAVQRLEQHRRTIERAITSFPTRFADLPARHLKRRWRAFYRWGGMMLYYRREYRTARRYLRKALLFSPRTLAFYLLACLRRTPDDGAARQLDAAVGRM